MEPGSLLPFFTHSVERIRPSARSQFMSRVATPGAGAYGSHPDIQSRTRSILSCHLLCRLSTAGSPSPTCSVHEASLPADSDELLGSSIGPPTSYPIGSAMDSSPASMTPSIASLVGAVI